MRTTSSVSRPPVESATRRLASYQKFRGIEMRLFVLLLPFAAFGQTVDQFNPPKASCCLQTLAQSLADQLQDWNQLGRYRADNERLKASPADQGRVVFMGDSITDGWKL